MIPRYARPKMTAIWAPENKFNIWLEIEACACEAQAEIGVIPTEAAKAVRKRGKFEIERIDAIERETHHDVIAFLTNVAEHVGPQARFIHQGMTSSDVLDTCLAVQLAQASDLLLEDILALLDALKRRAYEHKDTICTFMSNAQKKFEEKLTTDETYNNLHDLNEKNEYMRNSLIAENFKSKLCFFTNEINEDLFDVWKKTNPTIWKKIMEQKISTRH